MPEALAGCQGQRYLSALVEEGQKVIAEKGAG